MAEAKVVSPKPRRRLRWVGIVFAVFIVLLVVAYFVGTSSWMLKSVILTKVSTAMNAKVTVDDASISPFSSVSLRHLKVETKGPDPLLTADEVQARYSLMDIIKGNINVSDVKLTRPQVNLITFADETTNLDPITKQPKKEAEKKEPKEKKESKPPQVNLGNLAITDAAVKKVTERKDGTREVLLANLHSLTVANVGNDKVGKITISGLEVKMDQGLNSASNGVLAAKGEGAFDLALDAALKPKTVKGQTKVDVTDAKGSFSQAAGVGVLLNADLTPTQLNDVSVRLGQNGKNLGALTVSGPFDAEKMEGKLAVALSQVDRQALNIVGAAMGIDFNQTTISSTNTIELTQRGRVLVVNGAVLVGNFSATQKGQTTPALDLKTGYAVTYDRTNKTALIHSFTMNGKQGGAEFLRGALAKPMMLDLGKGSNAVDESTFNLVVTNFNLADWRAFAGTNVSLSSGKLGVNLDLVSKRAGKELSLVLATRLAGLAAASGSNRIDNADIALDARGTVRDFSAVQLDEYRAALARAGQQALAATGALSYDTKSQDADVQANVDVSLPEVTKLVSVPGLALTDGAVKFAGRVTQKNTTPQNTNNPVLDRSVLGKLTVDRLTGGLSSNRFDQFATAVDLDVLMHGNALTIRKCNGTLQQSGKAGGAFDVSGNYDTGSKAGQVTAKLTDLNQNALKSFLASALGEKQLESVSINANTVAKLDGGADGSVKAELHVANLVVNDPSGAVPHTPLAVDLTADVGMAKQVLDLKAVQLALTKTERAPNSVNVSGRIDMTKSNAYTGNVKIASDGLDVTPYYEIFAKKNTNTVAAGKTTGGAGAKGGAAEPKSPSEPAAIKLPVTQFTAELGIARFYLRELALSNFVVKTTVDGGRIAVNPFRLSLNGAPVDATVAMNVGVPGFEYDVTAKLDRVPVEPFVNTFQPERRGQVKGDLIAGIQVKGAGMTGPNLKKNLQGTMGLTLTNANVQITTYKQLQQILVPIALALRVPQISESPLTWVDAGLNIGTGTVSVARCTAESSVFRAGLSPGTISLDDVITNSVINKLPIDIALRRNIADAARLTPAGTPADVQYVALPKFAFVAGTVGNPKTEIDKIAVGRVLAGTLGNVIGGDAGKILKGLGNFGTGGSATTTTSTNTAGATNAPAATNSPVNNLLQGLGGFLQKTPKTNAPAKKR